MVDIDLPTPPPIRHHLLNVSVVLLALSFSILGAAIVVSVRGPHDWNPLGEYPDQAVVSRVDGFDGPAAHIDGVVVVVGTKCVRSTVRVRGSSFWQSTTPPGILVSAGAGVTTRPKGCTTQTFANPIPSAVRAAAARPDDPVLRWVITGTETPVRDTNDSDRSREGTPRAWTTQEFEIVP